ncbi:glycosyl hydrolase family 61-domain-containing protein [Collybia nuda]|uniref:lytic cellulose monooxygenase (C4-dehydrogenating) n=1 Tax=Collybia nuda TaxID=64659 RepID=A0A9P5XZJ4_9AGAR|nr:glycosyl hydrolase family 61-domain-containing protein [Collybia nuda]
MLTYMASCGSTPCNKFDSQGAKWFKIDQVGRKSNGQWAQQDLMNGQTAKVTLPSTLAPGNYLIRHEIIALHLANSRGGAEFYPSCSQLKVGGSQTGAPAQNELVALPGAYSDDDPGIFDPDVFNPGSKYVFPGPAVAKFVGAASAGGTDGGNASGSGGGGGDAQTPAPSAPASKPKPTGSCKLKKKSASANVAARTVRPRHVSRVMRGLIGHSH